MAKLAAEVLANPPPLVVAARRYLTELGGEHESAAAVAFLALLAGARSGAPADGKSKVRV